MKHDEAKKPGTPGREDHIDELLQELKPVDLPHFYRTRLLARVRGAGRVPWWRERLGAPRLAWSVAASCVVALVVVVAYSTRTTPPVTEVPIVQLAGSTIDPLAPAGDSVVGAGDVEIVAAIHPPIEGALVRLYVDERDVTGLAEVTESYVMYSPSERLEEGEHVVTIEITDGSGHRLRDVSWLFYTLNGRDAGFDPRT